MRRLMVAIAAAAAAALILGVAFAGAESPTVSVEDASNVLYTSAKAKGTVDPKGKETYCHFEYISQAQLEENLTNGGGEFDNAGGAGCSGNPHEGTGSQDVEADLGGLTPGTVYHLRLVASNEDGQSEAVAATFETKALAKPTVTIDPVTTFTGTTAHLSGSINPNASLSDSGVQVNWHFECTPACPGANGPALGTGNSPQAVEADVKGLEPNTDYEVKLIASDPAGEESAGPVSFKTDAVAPEAQTLPAFALEGGTKVQLGARINPHNSATTYFFKYGTTAGYGSVVPLSEDGAAEDGGSPGVFGQEIEGLAPGTEYHFKVIAESDAGTAEGEDLTFTTPTPALPQGECPNEQFRTGPSARLGECRAYELATPPDLGTHAFASRDVGSRHLVAVDGSRALWAVRVALPGVDSTGRTDTYMSNRSPAGWSSEYVSPPGGSHSGSPTLMWTSPDLEHLIWQDRWSHIDPADQDPVADPTQPIDETQYSDLYRRDSDGSFTWLTRGSQAPPVASEFNSIVGSSPDGQTVVFSDSRALEPGATSTNNVYERKDGTTTLVSVDENGDAVNFAAGLAASDDGGVVVFRAGTSNGIYIRDRGLTRTIHLQASEFVVTESLSRDGRKLSLISAARLTADDTDNSADAFEYDTTTESFTRLSKPDGSSGTGPGNTDACGTPLTGLIQPCAVAPVATSSDGSKTYFASSEQLDGSKGVDGGVNLYLAQGGTVRFVATLDRSDPDFGGVGGPFGTTAARHVRFTPGESKLLFESRARLTGYDNAGHVEIYVYDSADGSLVCASCRPDGTPPTGDASLRDGTGGSRVQFSWEPASPANGDEHGNEIFFMSTDPILAGDENNRYDVYGYTLATGEATLISSGTSENDSVYLGNGVDGKDVFFFTTDTLDPRDRNGGLFKLYDAREGGGFPPPPTPPTPCVGEGCRGAHSSTPASSGAASAAFQGAGNVNRPTNGRCAKNTRKVRRNGKTRCLKKRKKHQHKRDAKHNRRAGR